MVLIRIQYLFLSVIFCFLIAENNLPQNVKSDLSIVDTSLVSIKNKAQYLLNIADSLYNNNEDLASIQYYEDALEIIKNPDTVNSKFFNLTGKQISLFQLRLNDNN